MNRPLSELLARTDDDTPVAFGVEGDRTLLDLRRDAVALAAALASPTDTRWLVDSEDGYHVAVAIFAATIAVARVVLPPNLQPGTLSELAADASVVLTTQPERYVAGTHTLDPLAPGLAAAGAAASPIILNRDAALVELFTSGSSGPGRRVVKSLQHLEDEVITLENELAYMLGAARAVFATASPRHLYGLLFRVLWPLAGSRSFLRTSLLLPDELLQRIAALGQPVAVVSTPAHLRHLTACPRLAVMAESIPAVFSSGGPLEPTTARALEDVMAHAPIEIFGSTESGGVAWRRSSADDPQPLWRTMIPVEIAVDSHGCLVVTSPFVTPPAAAEQTPSWTMGDRVEITAGGFRLLGRADRMAKIGEKAFSLPALEACFVEHAWVEAVALASYRNKTGTRLGALVVLGPEGQRALSKNGRRGVRAELAEHVARTWDRLAIPRRWRFCEALPFDERGKLAHSDVEAALGLATPRVLEPTLLGEERSATSLSRRFLVPRDLAQLEGHYEAFPLVQGVVQIDWVMTALGALLGETPIPERMEAIKFKDVLRPAQEFTLRVDLDVETRRARFTLHDGERTFSSGRIVLAGRDETTSTALPAAGRERE